MAKRYRPGRRDQPFLFPPGMRGWLGGDAPGGVGNQRGGEKEETSRFHRDEAEDDLFGPGARGDEVPADAWSPRRRDQRIAAALASVRAGRQAAQAERDAQAQAYLQAAAAGQAPPGAVPADAAVAAARLRLERAEAAQRAKVAAWQQRRAEEAAAGIRRGPGGKPPLPPEAHFKVARAR